MRKFILITTLSILTILLISIVYLSIYGVKTDNFNSLINSKLKEYNSKLTLKLDDVFIKLNIPQGSISIHTIDSSLISENNTVKISMQ